MRVWTVPGADGRVWSVRRSIEWSSPLSEEDFEHDVGGDNQGTIIPLGALALFWAAVWGILYLRSLVHIPWYLLVAGALVLLCLPLRWVTSRWRTIVAETAGGHGLPEEHWSGKVRGRHRAAYETKMTRRSLMVRGTPGYAHSPLHPATPGFGTPTNSP